MILPAAGRRRTVVPLSFFIERLLGSSPGVALITVPWVLSLSFGGGEVRAQQSEAFNPGDRLRIESSNAEPFEGLLRTVSVEGLTLDDARGDSFEVPYSALLRIERASGRNRRKGALIGGAVGLVAGVVLGATSGRCVDCDDPYEVGGSGLVEASTAGTGAVIGGVLLGGAGALIGGLLLAPRHWVEVPVSR